MASSPTKQFGRAVKEPLRVVLLRHGESDWNAAKRFSGWVDIDLTEKGLDEAAKAGKLMRDHRLEFDEAHCSVLKRAVRTLWTALTHAEQHYIPVHHSWRLNERHYGALTGLSKVEAKEQLGADLLQHYRRGYSTQPPPMDTRHPHWPGNDRRYKHLGTLLPTGESLRQCKERVVPYWLESVVPSLRAGRRVIVAAHNNVLRCLCKHLDGINDDDLDKLELPTGVPLVYHLNADTLIPEGEPNSIGFRGAFLTEPPATIPESNPVGEAVLGAETLEAIARDSAALQTRKKGAVAPIEDTREGAGFLGEGDSRGRAVPPLGTCGTITGSRGRAGRVQSDPGSVDVHTRDVVSPELLIQEAMKLGLKRCPRRERYIQGFEK